MAKPDGAIWVTSWDLHFGGQGSNLLFWPSWLQDKGGSGSIFFTVEDVGNSPPLI